MNSHIMSILPPAFDHEIESCELTDQNNWRAVIHTECDSSEMCEKWVSEFSSSSLCTWRVRKTYPNPLRVLGFGKIIYVSTVPSTRNTRSVILQKTRDVLPRSL